MLEQPCAHHPSGMGPVWPPLVRPSMPCLAARSSPYLSSTPDARPPPARIVLLLGLGICLKAFRCFSCICPTLWRWIMRGNGKRDNFELCTKLCKPVSYSLPIWRFKPSLPSTLNPRLPWFLPSGCTTAVFLVLDTIVPSLLQDSGDPVNASNLNPPVESTNRLQLLGKCRGAPIANHSWPHLHLTCAPTSLTLSFHLSQHSCLPFRICSSHHLILSSSHSRHTTHIFFRV